MIAGVGEDLGTPVGVACGSDPDAAQLDRHRDDPTDLLPGFAVEVELVAAHFIAVAGFRVRADAVPSDWRLGRQGLRF